MRELAIKVTNLTKIYHLYSKPQDRLKEALNPFKKSYHEEFYALNNVSFEIEKGEVVGIIGKNGSGKSTLLKIITGVLTPSSGQIQVNGKISAILELGAGFNPEMSGIENIYLNSTLSGLNKEEIDARAKDIIEFSELGSFIYQPVKTYSSGMNARLAFGVAIHINPDILIVDEALSVGDAAFQRKCFAKMEEIRQSGATIIFVSHSEASIVSLCSRAIWMNNGEFLIEGKPKLVTGLYMKNSNKKMIDKNTIFEEFENLKKDIPKYKKKKQTIDTASIKEFYNPELKPKSTIFYEEKGAKISNVQVSTLTMQKVNCLLQGNEYIYSYKVDFINNNIKKVIFGMSLYMKNGINLVSGNYPKKNKFIEIKNNCIMVKWYFVCNILEGEYFLTAGVLNDKNEFMARIKDAYIIKVINNINPQMMGVIDIGLKGTIKDVESF